MSLIYIPEEDSYLLSEVLKKELPILLSKNKKLKFLEIGIGSGIQLKTAEESGVKKENIFGVDLNPEAVTHCQKMGFKCVRSDLFEYIEEKFDVIIFNPPYLPEDEEPEDEESKLITTGGVKGSEIPNKFLVDARSRLKDGGIIYLLVSSLTQGMNYLDYKKELVAEKKLFFEKLDVWKLIFDKN